MKLEQKFCFWQFRVDYHSEHRITLANVAVGIRLFVQPSNYHYCITLFRTDFELKFRPRRRAARVVDLKLSNRETLWKLGKDS